MAFIRGIFKIVQLWGVCEGIFFFLHTAINLLFRCIKYRDPELEPAGGTDEEEKKPEKTSKQPQPRRRFQWSKEIR